jgi:hypothetical protein
MKRFFCLALLIPVTLSLYAATKNFKGTFVDPKDPSLPIDFKFQGEYAGSGTGAQVIALDKGAFHLVLYPGGLPGAGWDGKNKSLLTGNMIQNAVVLEPATGSRKYLDSKAETFSPTRKVPPTGHIPYSGSIDGDVLTLLGANSKKLQLKKTVRKSPTIGLNLPEKAIVLFDGSNKDEWEGGRIDEQTRFLNTDGSDIRSKRKFSDYYLHLEFMLPFRPSARGQGRGNSGLYHVGMYENQILDSFGSDGIHNECGGIYSIKDSLVNACFPPLTWQTYDIEFTNAKSLNGKKIKNARITSRLNGIVIHENFAIPRKTGGARSDPEGTPGSIKLQGHGNPLQFRNIWILEK